MPQSTTPTTLNCSTLSCSHCGHQTDVDSRFAGKSGPCAGCGQEISIPKAKSPKKKFCGIGAFGVAIVVATVPVAALVGIAIVRPAIIAAREAAKCSECENNFRRIGLALEEYYDTHRNYPLAVLRNKWGEPMHSWRVLLLPHLGPEAQSIYARYDFSKPWDSLENSSLASEIPDVYCCPFHSGTGTGETSYLAVVGDRTVINTEQVVRRWGSQNVLAESGPTRSQTLVVIETKRSGVNWLEPVDIPIVALQAGLNSPNAGAPGTSHSDGANTLMADGNLIRLPDDTTASDLQAMATIDNEYIGLFNDHLYE